MKSLIRTCRFSPYVSKSPKFTLKLYDLNMRDSMGKNMLGYELFQDKTILFSGEDFHCSPLHGIDSDACVESIMSFLTLCAGDTDHDYFEGYNEIQKRFCEEHAESLSIEVMNRFCDENGNVK